MKVSKTVVRAMLLVVERTSSELILIQSEIETIVNSIFVSPHKPQRRTLLYVWNKTCETKQEFLCS